MELISAADSKVRFDSDGDGRKEKIGWLSGDDGWLALDRDGSGRIDQYDEISFVGDFDGAQTDLEGLLGFDSDGDGALTAADDRFDEFLIWQDKNGNGRSDEGELITLAQAGIESIDLYRNPTGQTTDGATDNVVTNTAFATFTDGRQTDVYDVASPGLCLAA